MITTLSIEEKETRVKELEEENKQLKNMELSILRALPEIVFILDSKGKFSFVNDTCLRKFMLRNEEINNGLYLIDVLSSDSIHTLKLLYREILSKNEFHARELVGIKRDGSRFPFTAYTAKLKNKKKTIGFIGVGFDLTERKEIENCLYEANAAKSKLFSIIAHDLKNPFNSLMGFSQLLLKNFGKYSPDKIKEYVSYINKSAQQGFSLLENLLEWSRTQTGKLEVQKISFDLVKLISEAYNLLLAFAKSKEISITLNFPENLFVLADENMIKTVLRNLISNAIKFTHRQGKIFIKAFKDNNWAIVEITDNGIGISLENLRILFNIDNEYSSLGTEKENGTGLGLILCQEFLNLNNGTIEVESKKNEGSTFRIRIPVFVS
jgi:PAS domain S-box-containing protein